jgi:hypothetical protein
MESELAAMRVIQTHARIGDDRVLHLQLPTDARTGVVEVLVVLGSEVRRPSGDERRVAAHAGRGALKGRGLSVEEFLAERREDEIRRDKALGL